MPREAVAKVRSPQESATTKLARFFPAATPVRIPVHLTRVAPADGFGEETVIEFGTSKEVLFASTLPLEFGDRLRVENADGSLRAEACVVALQYNGQRTAVAARFSQPVGNWIIKA